MRIASSSEALSRYASSNSFADLETAVESMDGTVALDSLTSFNFVARRRILVNAWARVLKAIELSYDPTYDPNLRLGCPTPPLGQMPCADPRGIPDPGARAKYATDLANYHHYIEQTNRYSQLLLLDERAMTSLEVTIAFLREVAPSQTSPDYAALESIVHQAGLSEERQAKIDTWLTVWYSLSARCVRVRSGEDPWIRLTVTNHSSTVRDFELRPLLSVSGRNGVNLSREIPLNTNSALVTATGLVKTNSLAYILGSPSAWVDLSAFHRGFPLGWYSLEYCDQNGTCSNAVQIQLR